MSVTRVRSLGGGGGGGVIPIAFRVGRCRDQRCEGPELRETLNPETCRALGNSSHPNRSLSLKIVSPKL